MFETIPKFKALKKWAKQAKEEGNATLKLALLGDFSTQLLHTAIKGMCYSCNINVEIYESDFQQTDIEVMNNDSGLYQFKPDWILFLNTNNVLREQYYKLNDQLAFADNYIGKIEQYYNQVQSNIDTKCMFSNFYAERDAVFSHYGAKVEHSFNYQLNVLNLELNKFLQQSGNAFLLDVAGVVLKMGIDTAIDQRMWVNSALPFSLDALVSIAYDTARMIYNGTGKFAKCLILDLDNTTWGGIIGDDGIENIQIGDLGIGKAFKSLQTWAKALKERGIILAVCSKNEESVAKQPFLNHPEMLLRMDDISVFVANWRTKVENIKYIQSVLNIGFDSMVFIDDNPMERDIVREHLTDVIVPELPEDPTDYLDYLLSLDLFSTLNYSVSDKDRTAQYQAEAKRVKQQVSYDSIGDYLTSLEMIAEVKAFDSYYISRIAQLTQRSNQFNPRSQRYTEEEVSNVMLDHNYVTRYILLKDRFGDYGLISNLILRLSSDAIFIENWVMSCRVLKRNLEDLIINEIVQIGKKRGLKYLKAEFIASGKNELVKDLYKRLGFTENESGQYKLEVAAYKMKKHQIQILQA